MSQFKIPSQEISQPHGAPWPFDPAFKLFGKTIPVLSPVAAAIDGGAPKDAEESVITSADSIAVSSMQDEGDEQSLSEDEGEAVFVPDELGSFSGSNDGGDQEKFSPESRAAGVENSAGVSNVQGSEIMAGGDDTGDDNKEEEDHGHEAQDGMPKKPDKPLPCPRCESLDTKFCYFNNYNVNQPRHFCKNCQRYWTAGGTLRNVPVGAGRRKHKHSSSHQRNVLPDGVAVRSDAQDTAQQLLSCSITPAGALNSQLNLSPSASRRHLLPLDVCSVSALDSPSSSTTILSFGQESPLCESMAAASLNPHRAGSLQGQGLASGKAFGSVGAKVGSSREIDTDMKIRYGCKLQMKNDISSATEASHETNPSVERQPMAESVCGSSVTTQWGNAKETGVSESPWDSTGFCEPLPPTSDVASSWPNAPPFAFFNAPWQYGYNIGWNNPAAAAAIAAPSANVPMVNGGGAHSAPPSVPNPACAPAYPSTWNGGPASIWAGIPWPLMQSPVWGPAGWNGTWSIPWSPAATAAAVAAAAAAASTSNPGLTSPTLGKHPRERPHTEGSTEGSLWIPKTLRIDDPGEAARSSIWTTLGLGTRPESFTSGGIFKAFQPKTDIKDTEEPPLQARHTNPAAMTRSMAFQESS